MQVLTVFMSAPFILSLATPAVTATSETSNISQQRVNSHTVQVDAFHLSDDKLTRDLNGLSLYLIRQYSPLWQVELVAKQAEGGEHTSAQKFRRLQLRTDYQLWHNLNSEKNYKIGLSVKAGTDKYQGVVNELSQYYGAALYLSNESRWGFNEKSSFGYQEDNLQGKQSNSGWYFDYQLNYPLSSNTDVYLHYQHMKSQHSSGLGIRVRFF